MNKKLLFLGLGAVLLFALVFGIQSASAATYYGGHPYSHYGSSSTVYYKNYDHYGGSYSYYEKDSPYEHKVTIKQNTGYGRGYYHSPSHSYFNYGNRKHYSFGYGGYPKYYGSYSKGHYYPTYRLNYGHGSYGYIGNPSSKYWHDGYHPPQTIYTYKTYHY